MAKNKRREGSLVVFEGEIPLTRTGLEVKAYNTKGEYIGKIQVNHAGVAVYAKRKLIDTNWERFFRVIEKNKK